MNHAFLSDLVLGLAACCYIAATVAFALHLAKKGGWEQATRVARWLMWTGVALHATHLGYVSIARHICPMKTIHFGVSAGGLASAFVYLAARRLLKIYGLGVFVAPIALVFLIAGRFAAVNEVSPSLSGSLLPLHVTANVLGDAFFVIASGAAAMYLFQERRLKTKRVASVFGRLPPIDALDRTAHIFLVAGFVLATIGAATGTIWVSKLQIGTTPEFFRLLLGYLTWLVFSAVLLLRAILGWRGRRAAYGTLLGFVFAMVVMILYLVESGGRS